MPAPSGGGGGAVDSERLLSSDGNDDDGDGDGDSGETSAGSSTLRYAAAADDGDGDGDDDGEAAAHRARFDRRLESFLAGMPPPMPAPPPKAEEPPHDSSVDGSAHGVGSGSGGDGESLWRRASYVWSPILLAISLFVTYYDIATGNTTAFDYGFGSPGTRPPPGVRALNVLLFTALLVWVGALEGAQVAIVSLAGRDRSALDAAPPRVQRVVELAHRGQNLERFIVGRQFLLVFLVFLLSKTASHDASRGPLNPFGWQWGRATDVIVSQNNVLLMLVIAVPGQLVGQLIAAADPVAFLAAVPAPAATCVHPSLALEATGVMHCAYVLKDAFARWFGVAVDSKTVMPTTPAHAVRGVLSTLLVAVCAVAVSQGVVQRKTHASDGAGWRELPGWAAFALFFLFIVVVGGCEGLQIAAVKLQRAPPGANAHNGRGHRQRRTAAAAVALLHDPPVPRLRRFLVGRQLFAAACYVLLARCTTFSGTHGAVDGGFWEWGRVPTVLLLQSGLVGAVLVTNVGVLAWRTAASCFPAAFLGFGLCCALLRAVLAAEATGVVASSWVLAAWVTGRAGGGAEGVGGVEG